MNRTKILLFTVCCFALIGLNAACRSDNSPAQNNSIENQSKLNAKAKTIEAAILRGESLNEADLNGLPPEQLRILRNAIFARRGKSYQRPGLGDYFATCDWYHPDAGYTHARLTAIDKQNVQTFVRSEETARRTTVNSNTLSADVKLPANSNLAAANAAPIENNRANDSEVTAYQPQQQMPSQTGQQNYDAENRSYYESQRQQQESYRAQDQMRQQQQEQARQQEAQRQQSFQQQQQQSQQQQYQRQQDSYRQQQQQQQQQYQQQTYGRRY